MLCFLSGSFDGFAPPFIISLILSLETFSLVLCCHYRTAAKTFLDSTGFNPEEALLERYVKFLCEDGLVDEGIKVYTLLRETGTVPEVSACNSVY
ncbi:hypothetical protein Bca101_016561 [Brassica carinata]